MFFFFSSRRRHTRYWRDWSSDVCSSDLDYPVSIEEHRRTVRTAGVRRGAVAVHPQGGSRLLGLKEEVDEGPLREGVPGEGQRLVHGEPADVLDLVRFQAERVGSDVALVHESEGVRGLAGEPGYVDVQQAVQPDVHSDLLLRFAFDADLRALAIVHESAGDVPISLRETA